MADDKAHPIYLGFAIGAIAVGVATGCIFAHYTHTDNIEIAAGFTALALIYILTQAIERVNELLINILDAVFNSLGKKFAETKKRSVLAHRQDDEGIGSSSGRCRRKEANCGT